MTTKLIQHTFEGSGRTIAIEPVSPLVIQDLRKRYPQPVAPMMDVPRPGGTPARMADTEDATYQQALAEWQSQMESRIRRVYISLGVKHRLTVEEKKEVDDFRAAMLDADPDMELDKNDLVVYITYICIKTNSDYTGFVSVATGGPSIPKSMSTSTTGASQSTAATSGDIPSALPTSPTPETLSIG